MRKDIADKWCQTLRSNEYKQGQGRLRCDDRFCCLGVLTDLYLKEHNENWSHFTKVGDGTTIYATIDSYTDAVNYVNLTNDVKEWAGMHSRNGEYSKNSLVSLNDTGSSFAEIADVIEREYESL